ncbi:hypothetical protein [Kingella pumchi]|uniref:DUF695 domain-containing protein n=1 Tax=Kingella pumchi TaxID=2779506 RepID=A0ABS9NKD6_9NEIS|nr:hypothetical protein [Kingella pumchi]MCG6503256.1 hypothetical protein [Kingella pumchi]
MTPHLQYIRNLCRQAQNFWDDWQRQPPAADADPQTIADFGNRLLDTHCPDVHLEFDGSGASGCLIFTADGATANFPLVQLLADHAPAGLPWPVHAFRQPSAGFAIEMNGLRLDPAQVSAAIGLWHEHPALILGLPALPAEQQENAQRAALILLDHIIGEWAAAVKIGAVDFCNGQPEDAFPLTELPQQLDKLWQTLGRDGRYPEAEWQYTTYQCDQESGRSLLIRNESAAPLVGRADMPWFVSVSCRLEGGDTLEQAYALQDAFEDAAAKNHEGIATLSVSNLGAGRRTVYAATANPLALAEAAEDLCRRYAALGAEAVCEYDPAWEHYRIG